MARAEAKRLLALKNEAPAQSAASNQASATEDASGQPETPQVDEEKHPRPSSPRAGPSLDVVTTFGKTGARVMLYPAHAPGRFYNARMIVGVLLMAVYLLLPWIRVGGAPAVFLNVAQRRFHLFGLTFLMQDLWLAFFVISGLGFVLFTVTAILGRIWCGWACPLTVFLDFVRRIERWIEGDALQRKRQNNEPWSFGTGLRRVLKHGVVGTMAAVVAHGFLAYFISVPGLLRIMGESPAAHRGEFLLVTLVSAALWFAFGWFREQFCIVLCPYGRLQSVLTDEHSLVIGYDAGRGEPRGKPSQGKLAGDCVDCARCVQVCPTGIDIRQGLQLECIGCAACVDACDQVMTKLHRPKGLIRYDSLSGLKGLGRRFWRPRLALYGVLLLFGITAGSVAVSTLRSAVVSLTRLPGAPYFVQGEMVRNQFLLRILNKNPQENSFSMSLEGTMPEGLKLQGEQQEVVAGWGEAQTVVVLTFPQQHKASSQPLWLVVRDASGQVIARKSLSLMGPEPAPQASFGPDLPRKLPRPSDTETNKAS